jgi:hypothetical protein
MGDAQPVRLFAVLTLLFVLGGTHADLLRAQTVLGGSDQANPAAQDQRTDPLAPPSPQPGEPGQPAPATPPIIPPRSPGFPSDIGGDRPRTTPDALRPDAVPPDSGVEVGVGAPIVSIQSHELQFMQGPKGFMSDGALLSADIVLNQWRFEYAKLLLRRTLDAGTAYKGTPVNFIGIDADQLWTFYGWWPYHNIYLAAGAGVEYRLTRLSNSTVGTTTTPQTVKAFTDNLTVWGFLANWAVSPPITLKFRAFQEEGGGIVRISGTAIQVGFIVPF